ncbi:MAG TPA: ABC transporter substrate-binding protein [Candidatus Methylomirabilis sp.]|nr:ABC transporter substrate-binding protein [Candidatus Methylomirabilis sp.]
MKPSATLLIVILALALLAAPVPSDAQQPAKVYRIGFLMARARTSPETTRLMTAFADGLREHGYIQGQNTTIEYRDTEAREERAKALAADLVSLRVDLIVAWGTAEVRAAKQATSTIPIVMGGVINPVERGLVASLAHPGGNVTGLTTTAGVEIAGKHLQLLKEAVPKVSRVAVLSYSGGPPNPAYKKETEAAAERLGLTLQFYGVQNPAEFEGAFAAMTKGPVNALLVQTHTFMTVHARRIVALAAKSRLPAVYPLRAHVEAGGFMSYGHNQSDSIRRLGVYVDKIFHGANPRDLPVEQPTKFELVINLKTAKTLGLTIPQSLLMRADEVIQ